MVPESNKHLTAEAVVSSHVQPTHAAAVIRAILAAWQATCGQRR